MTFVKDIMKPRKEIIEGKFQGVIQSHKVDSTEPRLENNAKKLLEITYVSSALKNALEKINEKFTKTSNQGAFLLIGPYGAGKTHGLVALYHLLKEPQIGKKWLKDWQIDIALPSAIKTCVVSTRRHDADFIWEPIFSKLGKGNINKQVKRFPTIDQIENVIGNETCAIFIDEIENWYGSFDPEKQSDLIERNETFLEHLFEVANDPNSNLLVFVTFLEEKEGLKKIFNRTKPARIDVSAVGDRKKILLHRLFENPDNKDIEKIETIVQKYMDNYIEPIKIENTLKYKQEMISSYPLHPLLLETLIQIFEAATERQNIRAMMNILADLTKKNYDKKDLFLITDLDEADFRGIDLNLVEKFDYDMERVKDISYGEEILKSVLIFTLNEKIPGATESDILLSIFSPTRGQKINSLIMDLENIYGKPYYLHKQGNIFLFRHDLNIFALMEKEKKNISDDDIKNKIAEITKKNIFDNRVFIYGSDDIPDDSKVKIIVSLESWGENDNLKNKLNDFYKGKAWQNTYIIVLPNAEGIFSSFEITEKTTRLIAGENLKEQVGNQGEKIQKLIDDEKVQIENKIKTYYGRIVKWVAREKEMIPRLINVSPEITTIRERADSDPSLVGDLIIGTIKNEAQGIKIESIINDFKKFRKFPQILDDEVIYKAISILQRDKRLLIQGDRGKWYIDEVPRSLEDSFSIFDPKYAPLPEILEPSRTVVSEGEVMGTEGGEVETEQPEVERSKKVLLEVKGNSPRVILSQIEARTREKDLFQEINIKYNFSEKISKQEIMKFIKQLPQQEEAEIEGEVELWREDEDI